MDAENVKFAGAPMKTLLRPHFISEEQERLLRQATESIMAIARKAEQRLLDGDVDRLCDYLGFSDVERRLIKLDPGYGGSVVFTRLDGFLDGRDLKFVEFNHDSPGGIGYADKMVEIFERLPLMGQMNGHYQVHAMAIRPRLVRALLDIYRQFGGTGRPAVAIVDWYDVKTHPDFEIVRDYFTAQGIPCLIADPRDLEYKKGKLYGKDFAIDLVYRRVLLGELLEKLDEVTPFLQAYEDRAACFINPFRCRLSEDKAFFELLTDESHHHIFTKEEVACLHRHIPWTRRVTSGYARWHGQRIDLYPYLVEHREQFVLKPSHGYGGQGVVIGNEVSGSEWERAVEQALDRPWVVQERVALPSESFPVVVNGAIDFRDLKVNVGPYYIDGQYSGCVARVSMQSVINVSAGGGSVPTFVIKER
jgi:glutathionylspermidine synthase